MARWPSILWDCLLRGATIASLASLLLPAALAGPRQDGGPAHNNDVHYKYQYAVDDPVSGVVNDRWEQRNGDFVKGQYSLLDPDGKVRTVDYEVDGERGFHAVIRTQYPANALLSIQAASQIHEVYQDSPVNVRAKNGLGVPDFALHDPRFSVRDNLPFNYHALDAAKIGIAEDDGAQLQFLDDDGLLTPREAQRRKYHRENHLLPHERLPQHDLEDQFVQQDTRQDLREPSINIQVEPSRAALTSPASAPSVFNPRAAYISLRPPPARPAVPPPNPPPSVHDLLLQRGVQQSAPVPATAVQAVSVSAPSASLLFRPAAAPVHLHTLALLQQPVASTTSSRSSLRLQAASSRRLSDSRAVGRPRPRFVQHLTETSPGFTSSRSYYLR